MAITSSAKRAIRVSARKRVLNLRRSDTMKDGMKALRKLSEAGNHEGALKALPGVYKAIDKAAKRGVIKKNTAARKKSRLVLFMKKESVKIPVVKVPKVAKAKK
ncbi:MAG: 30S ribosomal protein S20 [Candidatus Lloydbacteria bacterium RIFCSPHIGHO2_01_FULL_49_22]|uniref:Small ribosomal subunit protein bS20 n=1 Tax=Candidatus Lloydbacteria bacterium RIFCSPHIGHO2_01_FULL_49_22 TaxID=1798658 RepID=A0A1G2CY94_9BACT|nr:MAG: 30S ribosomal protein S20 [Candidatus Lloydbacteria bacterium RIFCSPHIGHO2_01_FULL_49_22]OGZ09812.1 MAG: 30S ribosomal protein S20 [Candidatus Lloydbacteria bacterium RIFCSPHIGHO2_02_FULL_50_18]